MQKYNLFFNEVKLSIINYDKNQIKNLRSKGKIIFEDNEDLDKRVETFLHNQINLQVYCLFENEEQLLRKLATYFRFKKAAGGIVYNPQGDILVMSRYGYYDFPKGHIEEGESPQETALREVSEETNVNDLLLQEKIGNTYHVFYARDQFYLKETQWFRMITHQYGDIKPQEEEHIQALWWFSPEEISNHKVLFYPSLQDLINRMKIH